MSKPKNKPITPYQRLLDDYRGFINKVRYANRIIMFSNPKETLARGYRMDDIWERVKVAEQLGYDVILEAKDDALQFVYRKRPGIPII